MPFPSLLTKLTDAVKKGAPPTQGTFRGDVRSASWDGAGDLTGGKDDDATQGYLIDYSTGSAQFQNVYADGGELGSLTVTGALTLGVAGSVETGDYVSEDWDGANPADLSTRDVDATVGFYLDESEGAAQFEGDLYTGQVTASAVDTTDLHLWGSGLWLDQDDEKYAVWIDTTEKWLGLYVNDAYRLKAYDDLFDISTHVKIPEMGTFASGGYATVQRRDVDGKLMEFTSHPRYKADIRPLPDALLKAQQLAAHTSAKTWKDAENLEAGWETGLLSTEVAPYWPEAVRWDSDGEAKGIHYEMLVVPLLTIVEDQEQRIKDLEQKVSDLAGGVDA